MTMAAVWPKMETKKLLDKKVLQALENVDMVLDEVTGFMHDLEERRRHIEDYLT
jgi:hypothetical protein